MSRRKSAVGELPPTDRDRELMAKMTLDPPGTVRSFEERIAFERCWNEKVIES